MKQMPVLDAIDAKILTELQRDARLTNAELAARVNLSASACFARVRALEASGVVERHVTLLNPRAVGLGVSVFVRVSLERQVEAALEAFEKAMRDLSEVMECYLMTADSDYLLRVVVADVEEFERFIVNRLVRIPGVASIRSSFALKQVKYKTELPIEREPAARRAGKRAKRD